MPDFPCLEYLKLEGKRLPTSLANSISLTMSRLGADPANLFNVGLGSNRSTWLGPPFMKS